ncbi:MAG: BrnT family toxin [Cyclobacteriaceae bacterium]|nr:BrnT family toxin [Cyclobacteriaceae bacterium]
MFEYDPVKSEYNKNKHEIDFNKATQLWNDPNRIIIQARTTGEPRLLLIAKLVNVHWSAIYTLRKDKIRIISVRKSRKNEREIYNRF